MRPASLLQAAGGITGMTFEEVVVAVAPFLIPIFLVIALLIHFPPLVTFLPARIG